MTILQLDRSSLQPKLLEDKDFDAYLWWDGYSFVPDVSAFWTTSSANPSGYADAALDELRDDRQHHPRSGRPQAGSGPDRRAHRRGRADHPAVLLPRLRGHPRLRQNVPTPSGADPNNTGIYYKVWELAIER